MRTSVWVAVVCPSTQRVLIARRAPTINKAGQWNLFGGGVGRGERPADTAVRELREEASISAAEADLIRLYKTALGQKQDVLYGLAVPTEIDPVLNAESDAFQWVSVNALPEMVNLHGPTWRAAPVVECWAATLVNRETADDLSEAVEDALAQNEPAGSGWAWPEPLRRLVRTLGLSVRLPG